MSDVYSTIHKIRKALEEIQTSLTLRDSIDAMQKLQEVQELAKQGIQQILDKQR